MCRRRLLLLPLVWVVLQACAPALNWRELRWVEDSRWWFPCKPERLDRELPWAGAHVPASMLVCDAQGATWSATAFELPSPAQAQQALAPARQALFDNMRAQTWTPAPMPGGALVAAPWVRLVGQRPGGQPVLAGTGRLAGAAGAVGHTRQGRPLRRCGLAGGVEPTSLGSFFYRHGSGCMTRPKSLPALLDNLPPWPAC